LAENEDRSGEDLSEEISQYRLEENRRKGQVSQSREVTGLLALLAAAVTAYVLSPQMGESMAGFMREVFRTDLSSRLDLGSTQVLHNVMTKALMLMVSVGLPIGLAGFFMGIGASFAQIGAIFSFDPLTPDVNKINPIEGIKKLFSARGAVEALRTIFKTVIVVTVCYYLIKNEVLVAPGLMGVEPASVLGLFAHSAKVMFLTLFSILALFAVADFVMQRYEHNKSLRLTKQEAKQEHKEREGDPQIKARIRAIQRDISRKRMMAAVKKADVIITNPTHIAIAIVYDRENMAAPKVVAKGADFIAQRIKKIAADAGIPTVENIPLARTLYKTTKVNQYVPRALYQAVAEVLAYVYRLRGRATT
jgi:flagellar biosynthetic protein FlhB